MKEKILSTVLHIVEDEIAKASVVADLQVEDRDLNEILRSEKDKNSEDTSGNDRRSNVNNH